MDRKQLVEAMAIGMLEAVRGIGWWGEISEDERKELREYARAALAVAEPAVREWERGAAPAIRAPLKLPTLPRVASAQFMLSDEAKRDIEVINAHTRRTGGTP